MQHISSDQRIATHIATADRLVAERARVSRFLYMAAWAGIAAGWATYAAWWTLTGGAW